MERWEEWFCVVSVVVAWALVLWAVAYKFETGVSGLLGTRATPLEDGKDPKAPVGLTYLVFWWTVATATALGVVHAVNKPPSPVVVSEVAPPPPYVVKIPGALGSSAHAFFSVGWTSGLAVFGISIDTWWAYALVCLYQMTRSVLGSLVNNVFLYFYNTVLRSHVPVQFKTRRNALVGRALTSIFLLWSTLTDILMSASQFDLFVFTVASTVAADCGYGITTIEVTNSLPTVVPRPSPPPPVIREREDKGLVRRSKSPAHHEQRKYYSAVQVNF